LFFGPACDMARRQSDESRFSVTDQQEAQRGEPESIEAEPQRQPVFNVAPVVVALIGLCAAIYGLLSYLESVDPELYWLVLAKTAFIPLLYSGQFEMDVSAISAPITYSLLHASIAHLAINMIWLLAFGSPLANRMGAARFLLFWVATAVAAAALHYLFHQYDAAPLVGASGAIAGMMGAAARFGFRIDRSVEKPAFSGRPLPIMFVLRLRPVVTFLAIWMAVNLLSGLFGLVPGEEGAIAWEAHVGGFLAGFFGVGAFIPAERQGARGQGFDVG
jgi:membrane associated rhomboid family serine protease